MSLNDRQIKELCIDCDSPMIDPFVGRQLRTFFKHVKGECGYEEETRKAISYGLGYRGYDIRLGYEIWEPDPQVETIVDPHNSNSDHYRKINNQYDPYIMPPHSFVLAKSLETFDIPPNIFCIAVNKSTYARAGIFLNVTPLEPGWKGILTLEIANLNSQSAKIYPGEGIVQIVFFWNPELPEKLYDGSYQDAKGIETAKIREQ